MAAMSANAITQCTITAIQTPVYASIDPTGKCFFSSDYTTTTKGLDCSGCALTLAYDGTGPVSLPSGGDLGGGGEYTPSGVDLGGGEEQHAG